MVCGIFSHGHGLEFEALEYSLQYSQCIYYERPICMVWKDTALGEVLQLIIASDPCYSPYYAWHLRS